MTFNVSQVWQHFSEQPSVRQRVLNARAVVWEGSCSEEGWESLLAHHVGLLCCLDQDMERTRACGVCTACKRLQQGAMVDVLTLEPSASNEARLGVDAVRRALQHVQQRPSMGRQRVVVIHRATRLTEAAQNALLKAIEEPGEHAYWVLTAEHLRPLLPSLRSRLMVWSLRHYGALLDQPPWLLDSESPLADAFSTLSTHLETRGAQGAWQAWWLPALDAFTPEVVLDAWWWVVHRQSTQPGVTGLEQRAYTRWFEVWNRCKRSHLEYAPWGSKQLNAWLGWRWTMDVLRLRDWSRLPNVQHVVDA